MIGEHKLGFTNDDQVRWNNNFEVREKEGNSFFLIDKYKKKICVYIRISVVGSCIEGKTCAKNPGNQLKKCINM